MKIKDSVDDKQLTKSQEGVPQDMVMFATMWADKAEKKIKNGKSVNKAIKEGLKQTVKNFRLLTMRKKKDVKKHYIPWAKKYLLSIWEYGYAID